MLTIGAHMSIADGFSPIPQKTSEEFGGNAMQFFTKSPRGRFLKPIDPHDAEQFKRNCKKYGILYVIAHSSYLLNFGKSIKDIPWAFHDIKTDFQRVHMLGGRGVVVHIGKSLDGDRDEAIKNVIENAKHIVEETEESGLEYILENTAGQGSEIGFQLEELSLIWKGLKGVNPRLKSCIDTAHLWAAGYDISTTTGVQKVLKEYDELVGLKTLSCFHFNDSKKSLGSKVDRHANIGTGFIALEGLKSLAQFAQQHSIPLILETPEKDGKTHRDDIEVVQSLLNQSI